MKNIAPLLKVDENGKKTSWNNQNFNTNLNQITPVGIKRVNETTISHQLNKGNSLLKTGPEKNTCCRSEIKELKR